MTNSSPAVRPVECISHPGGTRTVTHSLFRRLAMRARSALLLSLVLSALIGCRNNNTTPNPSENPPGADPSPKDDPNVDVGRALFSLAGPPAPPQARPTGGEPIV